MTYAISQGLPISPEEFVDVLRSTVVFLRPSLGVPGQFEVLQEVGPHCYPSLPRGRAQAIEVESALRAAASTVPFSTPPGAHMALRTSDYRLIFQP